MAPNFQLITPREHRCGHFFSVTVTAVTERIGRFAVFSPGTQIMTAAQRISESNDALKMFRREHAQVISEVARLDKALKNLRFEGKCSFGRNLKEAHDVLDFFKREVIGHIELEDTVLFPFLECHLPKLESVINLFRSEHREIKRSLRKFDFALGELGRDDTSDEQGKALDDVSETGIYLIHLLRNHIQAENESIYKTSEYELHQKEKEELNQNLLKHERAGGLR